MPENRRYSITSNRLVNAYYQNLSHKSGSIIQRENQGQNSRFLLRAIDGTAENSSWGRFCCCVHASEDVVYTIHIFALNHKTFMRNGVETEVESFLCDENVEEQIKTQFMNQVGEVCALNTENILLYELTGRYLWIYIDIKGNGQFTCEDAFIDVVGDNFMETFPEVYHDRNGFFHRYMSVYSSIYNDFQQKINDIDALLDVNQAPLGFLEVYASWFGIDLKGGFLDEEKMRILLREIYDLVKIKGTRTCLERVAEIALGKKPVIIEKNLIHTEKEQEKQKIIDDLYGASKYDVVLLTTVDLKEYQKAQLMYFLEQFMPIRCKMNVIFLRNHGEMDHYTYLGINASLTDMETGMLDTDLELDQMIMLQ